jgi:hypothetical protein
VNPRSLSCHGGGRYTVRFQGTLHAGGQDYVDVEFRLVAGAACQIMQPVTMSVEDHEHLLPGIEHNPLTQHTDFRLTAARPYRQVSPDWANWCDPQQTGFTLVVRYRDRSARRAAGIPPSCVDLHPPSRLIPGRPQ